MKQRKEQNQARPSSTRDGESLSYTVEVRDKRGRLLKRISRPSRSYVEQWNRIVNIQAHLTQSSDPRTVKDTSGTNLDGNASSSSLRCNSGIGGTNRGIRVGKGNTAVAIDDYALESPCGEGTGVDQVEHQEMVFTEPSVAGSTCSFTAKRLMINNSGATIAVREIGCYVGFRANTSDYYALGFRDVLPSSVGIPDGGSIRVTYTLKVTV